MENSLRFPGIGLFRYVVTGIGASKPSDRRPVVTFRSKRESMRPRSELQRTVEGLVVRKQHAERSAGLVGSFDFAE